MGLGRLLNGSGYNKPLKCSECNGTLKYMGIGEYKCEDCGHLEYDDYGKVRLYLESHNGANAVQIEKDTGVSQKEIRRMLQDERLEVSSDSKSFLHCENCGKEIRYGIYCEECARKMRGTGETRNFGVDTGRNGEQRSFGYDAQRGMGPKGEKDK